MTTGTVHDLADDLSLIEGHHPQSLWEDPDLPTIAVYRRGPRLYLLDTGWVPSSGAPSARSRPVTMQALIASGEEFASTVDVAVAGHPEGVTIDDLYDELVASAGPTSTLALLVRLQFPVFSTFLKLTLLNHCLLRGFTEGVGASGRPTFRAG